MDQTVMYQSYAVADPDFYEPLHRWDDRAERYRPADADPPEGWRRSEQEIWVSWSPDGVKLPAQGWKVHVSATPQDSAHVLGVVLEHCVNRTIAVKFLRSVKMLWFLNSKYAHRGSSGKFCTLYPADEDECERLLRELGPLLADFGGPYVLSDLRWRSGPLYTRYGAFGRLSSVDDSGERVPALRTPEGNLVPDRREPVFRAPSWLPVPEFLRQDRESEKLPYRVERALHFSNGGGVYLAADRSGRQVVLKEARPWAGLDHNGEDAVARLKREHDVLRELTGARGVPAVFELFTCWEHHFLAEEYVTGTPLAQAISGRHPFTVPDATPAEVAGYTDWVLDVRERVGQVLDGLHRRGIAFNDLHPRNIILRPDGTVTFVDFELAAPVDRPRHSGLGVPGFALPSGRTGIEADRHALACLTLWMFLPMSTSLLARDPRKVTFFARFLTDRFAVPATVADDLVREVESVRPAAPERPAPLRDDVLEEGYRDWPSLRKGIADAIIAAADPRRPDRLFPGDVQQARYGGFTLAHGAAGVLYALWKTGAQVVPEHVRWLTEAARTARDPLPGLYNGLHGAACVLELLGHRADALTILDRAIHSGVPVRTKGLFGGLSGIGLSLLHFAEVTEDPVVRTEADAIAERLGRYLRAGKPEPDQPAAAGLLHGLSGAALFLLRHHALTGEAETLELASLALRRELEHCAPGKGGTLEVRRNGKALPYLGTGTAGVGLVLREFLRFRADERFRDAGTRIRDTCRRESGIFPGLFSGHAGLLAYLAGDALPDDRAIRFHLKRMSWTAERRGRGIGFAGDQLMRLSTDLATGSAGVLLALHTVFREPTGFLPLFPAPAEEPVAAGA
ncbi:class III lanthionine synthetase LanKC [Saccharothrix sp. AJ9571]|nr:class III lanthionine synthetase LanKC [Saccharothrix sp. AJ9571]